MSLLFDLDTIEQHGELGAIPAGTIFTFNNKKYIKLCNDSPKNSLAITLDPLFVINGHSGKERGALHRRVLRKMADAPKSPGVVALWPPTEEEYADYSNIFKRHIDDQWLICFDEDNSIQDIDGVYIYADEKGILRYDNVNSNFSKNHIRGLSIRAMCLIDRQVNVAFRSVANRINEMTKGRIRYDLFSARFCGM